MRVMFTALLVVIFVSAAAIAIPLGDRFEILPFADIGWQYGDTLIITKDWTVHNYISTGIDLSIGARLQYLSYYFEGSVKNIYNRIFLTDDTTSCPLTYETSVGAFFPLRGGLLLEPSVRYANGLSNREHNLSGGLNWWWVGDLLEGALGINYLSQWIERQDNLFEEKYYYYPTEYIAINGTICLKRWMVMPYAHVGFKFNIGKKECSPDNVTTFGIGIQLTEPVKRRYPRSRQKTVYKKRDIIKALLVKKPNIYLYPRERGFINVRLLASSGNSITKSEPLYNDGWRVYTEPSGRINGEYDYLFYEATLGNTSTQPSASSAEPSKGWCVAYEELWDFFKDIMREYGFNTRETNDFADYWSKHLAKSAYYDIFPLSNKDIDKEYRLQIEPKPDVVLRLWFYIVPKNTKSKLIPPIIPIFLRTGFTVTEWGVILEE